MPTQATIRKIGVNPFAVAASKGLKRGTPEYERVVQGITRSALARKRKRKVGLKK